MFRAALILMLCASGAQAQTYSYFIDGTGLTKYCRSYLAQKANGDRQGSVQSAYDAGFCQGVVYSALDARAFLPEGQAPVMNFCLPDQINANDAVEVVARFLDTNPALRSQPAYILVRRALAEAYPC